MTETIPVRLVIGADGAYSATRTSLMRLSRIDYSQRYVLGAEVVSDEHSPAPLPPKSFSPTIPLNASSTSACSVCGGRCRYIEHGYKVSRLRSPSCHKHEAPGILTSLVPPPPSIRSPPVPQELEIPPGPDGKWQLEPANALHIWPRHEFMCVHLSLRFRRNYWPMLPWGPLGCTYDGCVLKCVRVSSHFMHVCCRCGRAGVCVCVQDDCAAQPRGLLHLHHVYALQALRPPGRGE
jgi:hypothetical protein